MTRYVFIGSCSTGWNAHSHTQDVVCRVYVIQRGPWGMRRTHADSSASPHAEIWHFAIRGPIGPVLKHDHAQSFCNPPEHLRDEQYDRSRASPLSDFPLCHEGGRSRTLICCC